MASAASSVASIPALGFGLGYRSPIRDGIMAHAETIDCVEIITENYTRNPRQLDVLAELREHFQVIPHGVDLSIGSFMPLNYDYLRQIKQVSDLVQSPYYSEHLCLTRSPGISLGHLSPLWFTEDMLHNTVTRVRKVQDYLNKPLVLENVTYQFDIPGAGMSQAEFFARLVEQTGCGILLDVHNVYTNSVNHHFDPLEFLAQMPLQNVVQIHIAGGYWNEGMLVDGHSHPVPQETWRLLEWVARRATIKSVILEHDVEFPAIETLVAQVARSRELVMATKATCEEGPIHATHA